VYLVSYNSPPIDTEDLHEPSKEQWSFINTACIEHYKEYQSLPEIQWYIKNKKREDPKTATAVGFAGISCKVSPKNSGFFKSNPYGICLASYIFKECLEYIMWVIRHEMRHCMSTSPKMYDAFRFHDVEFIDQGWENKKVVSGFFNEDFAAVACCDKLMRMFQNLVGLEEYLG
jgi:hypothetical protein